MVETRHVLRCWSSPPATSVSHSGAWPRPFPPLPLHGSPQTPALDHLCLNHKRGRSFSYVQQHSPRLDLSGATQAAWATGPSRASPVPPCPSVGPQASLSLSLIPEGYPPPHVQPRTCLEYFLQPPANHQPLLQPARLPTLWHPDHGPFLCRPALTAPDEAPGLWLRPPTALKHFLPIILHSTYQVRCPTSPISVILVGE